MQARVITDAGVAGFDMLMFPDQDNSLARIAANQMQYISATLTDAGASLMQAATQTYNNFMNSEGMRRAKAAVRMVSSVFHPNLIYPLTDIRDVQNAQPLMQRYIMAQPDLRALYNQQLCDGYTDSYIDQEPGAVGEDHYDYRRVMQGSLIKKVDAEGQTQYYHRQYLDDLHEGDRELTMIERHDIKTVTWETVKKAMAERRDPSSMFDIKLS